MEIKYSSVSDEAQVLVHGLFVFGLHWLHRLTVSLARNVPATLCDIREHVRQVHSESDLPWPAGGANPLSYAMMSSEQLGDVSALETVRQVFRSDSG